MRKYQRLSFVPCEEVIRHCSVVNPFGDWKQFGRAMLCLFIVEPGEGWVDRMDLVWFFVAAEFSVELELLRV